MEWCFLVAPNRILCLGEYDTMEHASVLLDVHGFCPEVHSGNVRPNLAPCLALCNSLLPLVDKYNQFRIISSLQHLSPRSPGHQKFWLDNQSETHHHCLDPLLFGQTSHIRSQRTRASLPVEIELSPTTRIINRYAGAATIRASHRNVRISLQCIL